LKHFAVIDLGSNTFHLLISKVTAERGLETVFRKRIFTGLSDGGVDHIKAIKILEGIKALQDFKLILDHYQIDQLKVVGTAVLRKALNRFVFLEEAEKVLGTNIEIIDGMKEADYIFKGISLLPELNIGTHLIMDVGGGSTEFILIADGKKLWSNSYPLGVGILHEKFHKTEPIHVSDLKELADFVFYLVEDMVHALQGVSLDSITGASGSFEILELMSGLNVSQTDISVVDKETFISIYKKIILADVHQRSQMEGLPAERVKLIVVGMALINTIVEMANPTKIIVSPYALKEGVLREMANL